ncbi:hypothetical protein MLD38_003109 [Melastoma candidum]|uniref:Uncharacterized protein n=1 Tax=Melastoma candidum TaxID=119954 RepID=A0ACB9S5Z5_9MYRT|nr:hypothetical protein MLD38_003109 [Melastoma candidum]
MGVSVLNRGRDTTTLLLCSLPLVAFILLLQPQHPQGRSEYFPPLGNHSLVWRGRSALGGCDWFRGKWVYDPSYPPYDPSTCPYIDPQFDCVKYGRPDREYLKYRWQPYSCDVPRFNAGRFLEGLRGKKLMFVGDSLSLNIWESLACLLHRSLPNARTFLVRRDGLASLTYLDYNVKILLYRTQFLVDLVKGPSGGLVLKLDSINNGHAWMGMDILVFNSWHWWTHTGRTQPWSSIEEGGKMYKDMNRLVAYYKAMTTWARWVNRNIDPSRTKVFFQGVSPTHYEGKDWGEPTRSCGSQTQPYFGARYPAGTPVAWYIVNKVLGRIKKPVYLLDITGLSQYRKDAHPSFYSGERGGDDCSHWCLPGLPDTWNELLFVALFN